MEISRARSSPKTTTASTRMKKSEIPGTGLLYFPIAGPNDEPDLPTPGSKRRRLRGACAECRQRKIRCDRAKRPNNVCSNCVAFNSACTDARAEQPDGGERGKPPEEHINTILAETTRYIPNPDVRGVLTDVARYAKKVEEENRKYRAQLGLLSGGTRSTGISSASYSPSPSTSTPADAGTPESIPGTSASFDLDDYVIKDFQELKIDHAGRPHYFGRSSGHYLVKTAVELKEEWQNGEGAGKQAQAGPEPKQGLPLVRAGSAVPPVNRGRFWLSSWEQPPPVVPPTYRFPPKDLMDHLIECYFTDVHILIPILHRPSFERDIAAGLHLADVGFGALVLGVCALGARCTDDPRVIYRDTNTLLSAGWEWLEQIRYPEDREFYSRLTLHGIQRLLLTIVYLQGTSAPGVCWTLVSLGLRNMQDMGWHRRRRDTSGPPTVEYELSKRVFWMYIVGDVHTSAFLGRPRATRYDDYDLEYPVDCDEEYWEDPDPERRFKQPPGKPSISAFLVSHLKLLNILGKTQESLYSLNRETQSIEASQAMVAQLDSELNQWLDSVPDHLRWDPQREDPTFSKQSATLYATYYHVQLQIHRNFIPTPSNQAPLFSTFPSLTICSNAARALTRVMENQLQRKFILAHPMIQASLMDAALVLLVNVWGARRSGATADPARAMADLRKCLDSLEFYETRWQQAGRFRDTIMSLGYQVLQNPPANVSVRQLKRPRVPRVDDYAPESVADLRREEMVSEAETEPTGQARARTTAGSRRVEAAAGQQPQQQQNLQSPPTLYSMSIFSASSDVELDVPFPVFDFSAVSLPLSTEELGHAMPEYPPFAMPAAMDWTSSALQPPDAFVFGDSGVGQGAFSYADFDFVFNFADSALRMPVPELDMQGEGGGGVQGVRERWRG